MTLGPSYICNNDMEILGNILAAGNNNSRVTFQRLDTEPWYGIVFNAAENGMLFS